jgi:uroporphyrinogen-III synthase
VVTTRDTPGRLDELLIARGATVVHVPLIEIGAPPDAGAALSEALARLPDATWLVVTSQHGAEAVGIAAGKHQVRLAAVGSRTAEVLARSAGRPVDLVPTRHTAADLVAAFPRAASEGELVVVAVGDLAAPTLSDGLRELGYDVVSAVAYSTRQRMPSGVERAVALDADAVVFASGSSAGAWADTIGLESPPVVAIGPTTAAAAIAAGLQVAVVAADHSLEGVVSAVTELLR